MIFHGVPEALLGRTAIIRILHQLIEAPGKVWASRELARAAGVSHTSVLRLLDRLQKLGVVDWHAGRHTHQIVLADTWTVREVVRPLFDSGGKARTELLKDLTGLVSIPGIRFAALFGSVASGTETPESDIDLLVIASKPAAAERRIFDQMGRFSKKYGRPLAPMITSEADFRRKINSTFICSVRKNHIVLKGRWP